MSPSTIGPNAAVSKSSSEASYASSAAATPKGSSNASYPSATDAATMAHVRTAIDDLDRQIVTLLGWSPSPL
jgi:hypothetical protein